jgi:tetratricopeptide (TPR) repeat protein
MPAAQRQNRKEKANSILAQLKSGGDFAALAKKFSEDPLSGKKGGSLGAVTAGMLPKELEDAAFLLSPEVVSEIIETPQGYYILKVKDKRLRQSPDQNKDIRTYLMETKQGRAQAEWQKELDEKYKVEITNKLMLGLKALAEGKLAEAAAELFAAQIEQPNNPYLQLILSEIYEKQGNKNLALKSMLKAAGLSPGDPKIHMLAGKAYSKNKDRRSALAEFKKASILAGEDTSLHEEILAFYKNMNAGAEIVSEQKEISRIKKKKEFEEEMRKKSEELLPEMPLGDKAK